MKFAVDNHNVGYYCLFFCFCIMSSLYILDFSYWESKCMRIIRAFFLVSSAILFLVGTFFSAADYPYSPLVVFMLIMPFYLLAWRKVSKRKRRRDGQPITIAIAITTDSNTKPPLHYHTDRFHE